MKMLRVVLIGVALTVLMGPPALAQAGHDLFQQALVMEQAEGNLRAAIQMYERIADEFAGDRELVARALVQMGRCYEKLGLTDAREVYRRVIDDFPEQRSEVAIARGRLASLAQELAELRREPTLTKIEIASKPQNGVLSPDGEKLAFVSEGAVWVVPLHGKVDPTIAGAPARIGDVDGVWDNCSQLAWSGDGQWIAVNGGVDSADAVYIVPATGGDPRMIRMPKRGSHAYSYRVSVSPDGGSLAFSALGREQEEGPNETQKRFIYSISVPEGVPRQLTDMWGRLPAFSPDGETIAYVSHRQRESGDWESDLWLVPASGGEPVKVISSDSGRIRGPVWSPNGDFLAAHHEPGLNNFSNELWVVPVDATDRGSTPIGIRLPNASWNMLAGWTPDDRLGVFMSTPEQHGVAYTVPAAGGKPVQVTSERGRAGHLAWSPDGQRIYLHWEPEWGDSIPVTVSLQDIFGVGFIPVAGGPVSEIPAAWGSGLAAGFGITVSPDGSTIAFMGIEGVDSTIGRRPQPEHIGIWTVATSGGAPQRLTSGPTYDAFPSWSPDGRQIAILRMADGLHWNVHVLPASGGGITGITSDADSVTGGRIAFSPDGTKIAYFSGHSIKVVPVHGGRSEVVATTGDLDPFPELSWSPDGTRIAHTAGDRIWVDDVRNGRRTELATGLSQGFRYSSVAWSPDGERIAFVAWRPSEKEFWLISDFLPQER